MASIDRAKNKKGELIPGAYSFACDCGYIRTVNDAEVWFTCERPIEPKVPACKIVHHLSKLVVILDAQEKRASAEEFLLTHDEKLAEARQIIATVPPLVEKKMKRGPKR